MELNGKIAIITGAGRGVGAAISNAMVAKGSTIYGLARNGNDLNMLLGKLGERLIPESVDIRDQKRVYSWVENTFSDSNSPKILINNVGTGHFGKIDELTLAEWHAMIDTNVNGLFYVTSQIVPFMKRNKGTCHIINIGSVLGRVGRSGGSAHCLTKYGVQGFSEALFKILRSDKIEVSCVNPGSIATDFFRDSGIESNNYMLRLKDLANLIVHLLETPDNLLIDELRLQPLIPKPLN